MFPIGKTTTQHEEMVCNTMHGIELPNSRAFLNPWQASEYGDEESEQEEPGDPSAVVEMENDGAAPANTTAEGQDLDAELEDEDAINQYEEDDDEEDDGDATGVNIHPSQEDEDDDDVMSE